MRPPQSKFRRERLRIYEFFRDESIAWDAWDATVLARLDALADLGRPLCVGVSRKSFLGAITGHRDPAERLPASLAATTVAVLRGASVIRTHDVAATVDAVRVAERLAAARQQAIAEGPDSLRARSVGGLGGASRAPQIRGSRSGAQARPSVR